MSEWIDFKEARKTLSFKAVLEHYGVEVRAKGNQHQGFCPLPNHQGQGKSPSFSANLSKGIFQCFGCKATGNVLDFAALMEKADPKDGKAVREIVGALMAKLGKITSALPDAGEMNSTPAPASAVINAPLDFELKSIYADHPYLRERGFSEEMIRKFHLGYCARGFLKGRIAIPLHDNEGTLIGYAGRLVNDGLIDEENPKYLFPSTRLRGEQTFEFRKSLFLYNGHRIQSAVNDLIVVESFPSVLWLTQHRFNNVVALMGSSCSDEQAKLIIAKLKPTGCAWVFTDGDDAGKHCALDLLERLTPFRACRWVRLEKDKQPTDLCRDELNSSLQGIQRDASVSPKQSDESLKALLMIRAITKSQAIVALTNQFPALAQLQFEVATWDANKLDRLAGKSSSGERCSLQFILHVWNPFQKWQCGEFNVMTALDTWDKAHREVFLLWANDPWWC